MRLKDKSVSPDGRLRKTYDSAQTPLDRLLASDIPNKSRLIALSEYRKSINPLLLREKIDQTLGTLLDLPCL